MALIYSTTGQLDEAKNLLLECMNISLEIGYKEGIAHSLLSLGNFYKECIHSSYRYFRKENPDCF